MRGSTLPAWARIGVTVNIYSISGDCMVQAKTEESAKQLAEIFGRTSSSLVYMSNINSPEMLLVKMAYPNLQEMNMVI